MIYKIEVSYIPDCDDFVKSMQHKIANNKTKTNYFLIIIIIMIIKKNDNNKYLYIYSYNICNCIHGLYRYVKK